MIHSKNSLNRNRCIECLKETDGILEFQQAEIRDYSDTVTRMSNLLDFFRSISNPLDNIYQIYNTEFVDSVADFVGKKGYKNIVECFAGNGLLSYHLWKRGINVIPTDSYSEEMKRPCFVRKIRAQDMLAEFSDCDLVIVCWEPNCSSISHRFLAGKVDLLWIGDIGCCGLIDKTISKYDVDLVSGIFRYSLCRADIMVNGFFVRHSRVYFIPKQEKKKGVNEQ